jgi:hypothetical protein
MKTYTCPQLSDEWWELRRGRPTASAFDRILTPKTGKIAAAADDLIYELIAEQFHREPMASIARYQNDAMKNGVAIEPEARKWYEFERDCAVEQVGFITDDEGRFGCSPDGLIGTDGGLEIKSPSPKVHARYFAEGVLPADYRCQVHGDLIISERKWWDFVSYCPAVSLPPLVVRVVPDEFTETLRAGLEQFWTRYQETLDKIRRQAA